jgi:hypothetical protein
VGVADVGRPLQPHPSTTPGFTKVTLQADWYPRPEHGGFYTALLKGYYKDQGLDLTIQPGSPHPIPDQQVAVGAAHSAWAAGDRTLESPMLPRRPVLWHSSLRAELTMRSLIPCLTFIAVLACSGARAQVEPPQVPGARPAGAPPPRIEELYAEDGGARGSTLESIVIPPKPNAPFTLILETEWVRGLSDGGNITLVNKRRIARDVEGRIYQERWWLVPKNGKAESAMNAIQISDPNAHTLYTCFMLDPRRGCELVTYTPSPGTLYKFQGPPSGPLPGDAGDRVHLDLGKQLVSGVEVIGERDTVNYNPGIFGNDRKMTIEREFWYSPKLGFNLLSKRSDPRYGSENFTATNLVLSDPEPKLFELPEGFTVIDHRQTAAPQN